jgi:hypothetical protein
MHFIQQFIAPEALSIVAHKNYPSGQQQLVLNLGNIIKLDLRAGTLHIIIITSCRTTQPTAAPHSPPTTSPTSNACSNRTCSCYSPTTASSKSSSSISGRTGGSRVICFGMSTIPNRIPRAAPTYSMSFLRCFWLEG